MSTYTPSYVEESEYSDAEKIVDLLSLMSEHGCDTPDNIDLALTKLINLMRTVEGEEQIYCNDVVIVISKKDDDVFIEVKPSF